MDPSFALPVQAWKSHFTPQLPPQGPLQEVPARARNLPMSFVAMPLRMDLIAWSCAVTFPHDRLQPQRVGDHAAKRVFEVMAVPLSMSDALFLESKPYV